MKEEQRYVQQLQIEKDRNTCLKGIWDELKVISGLLKVQTGASPICKVANKEDLIFGVDLAAKDSESHREEKLVDVFKYEDYANALDKQREGDYRGAKFNGEWHGEHIDPSDPRRK